MHSLVSMNVPKELLEKLHLNKAFQEAYMNTTFNWYTIWSHKVKIILRNVCYLACTLVHKLCLFGEEMMGFAWQIKKSWKPYHIVADYNQIYVTAIQMLCKEKRVYLLVCL